jgi:hypothetical protein
MNQLLLDSWEELAQVKGVAVFVVLELLVDSLHRRWIVIGKRRLKVAVYPAFLETQHPSGGPISDLENLSFGFVLDHGDGKLCVCISCLLELGVFVEKYSRAVIVLNVLKLYRLFQL